MSERFDRRRVLGLAGYGALAALAGTATGAVLGTGTTGTAWAAEEPEGPALLFPGDEGFDAERRGFNPIVRHHPKAIALPAGTEEAAAAVRYARRRGWPVAVQSTGHGIGVAADGALLVNTRRMTKVTVDPATRRARIGGGVRWGAVVDAVAPHGLGAPSGTSTDVGVTGYTMGGGLGLLGRTHGYAADLVRSVRIVTPDGCVRTAAPGRNPALFWGVRGAKSNLGLVTETETDLFEVREVYGGVLNFPGAQAGEVLSTWSRWSASLTERTTGSLQLLRLPDDPVLPPPMRGRFIASVAVGHLGTAEEAESVLRPLRALGPFMDTAQARPYDEFAAMFNEGPAAQPIHERSGLVRALDTTTVQRVLEAAGPDAELPTGVVSLRLLGGALGRPSAIPNAVGLRDAACTLYVANPAPPEAAGATERTQERLLTELAPALTGGIFPNFLGHADAAPARVRRAYRESDYVLLSHIKRAYDPDNIFRMNHNIPPA